MAGTDFDLIIGAYKAKIVRDGERRGYNRRTVRREIQQQLVSQAPTGASILKSRADGVGLYQTSWAGGAQWWQPLIGPGNMDGYFQGNHMDVWSEPGKIVPSNKHVAAANTDLHNNSIMATDGTSFYAIGDDNTTDAAERSVYKWTPGSDAWVRETTYSSGIQDDSIPHAMCYDPEDGYFYVLAETAAGAREIGRFNPVTPAHDLSWLTAVGLFYHGANIIKTEYGIFVSYGSGNVLVLDKSGPTEVLAFAAGSVDLVANAGASSNVLQNTPLLIGTSQGIYLVRNQTQNGQPVAFVYRIDRDISGSYIGNPITTLPLGSVALSAQFHMGQLLVSTTPDYASVIDGADNFEVIIYFVGEGGKGALGSVLGSRDKIDESPYQFLGTDGSKVYLAGNKRLWVYDAVLGGLHSAFEWESSPSGGMPFMAMGRTQDSAGAEIMHFIGRDLMTSVKTNKYDNPDTVAAFGDDEAHYVLTSNWFDGGLPHESKELTRISIDHDAIDSSGDQEWTVQGTAEDESFTDLITNSVANSTYKRQTLSGITGRRFRYRAIYQTKAAIRAALRGIMVTMSSGEMVTEWDVYLDGDQLMNVNNELQDEGDFRDDMVALGNTETVITLIDNMKEHAQETEDDDAGESIVVIGVEIIKEDAGESVVHLIMREA